MKTLIRIRQIFGLFSGKLRWCPGLPHTPSWRPGLSREFTLVTAVLVLVAGIVAEGRADRQSLVDNSPFVWEGYVPPEERQPQREPPPPPPPQDDPLDRLEVRGIFVMGGETRVSFFHPDDQEGFWLAMEDSEGDYTLVDFDGGDSVTVRRGERERAITLKEVQVAEMPRGEQRSTQSGQQRSSQSSTRQENAERSDEQLRRAAEELRRRRAIRQPN